MACPTRILFGATTLSVALVVDNVMNGLAGRSSARYLTGSAVNTPWRWPSRLGASATGCWLVRHQRLGVRPCAALIFFTWGEIFSLFPSTCTDLFGTVTPLQMR